MRRRSTPAVMADLAARAAHGGTAVMKHRALWEGLRLLRYQRTRSAWLVLARFFAMRHRVRPHERDGAIALELYAPLLRQNPRLVPADVVDVLLARYAAIRNRASIEASQAIEMRDLAGIDRATALLYQAVTGMPKNRTERTLWLCQLALITRSRYEQTGEPTDLDRMDSFARQALEAVVPGESGADAALTYAYTLLDRHTADDHSEALDECLAWFETGLNAIAGGYASRKIAVLSYAQALVRKVQITGDVKARHRVESLLRWAARAFADDPVAINECVYLTGVLLTAAAAKEQDPHLRQAAITQLRKAVSMADPSNLARYTLELVDLLLRPLTALDPAEVREALTLLEPSDGSLWSPRLSAEATLLRGKALVLLAEHGAEDTLDRGLAELRIALATLPKGRHATVTSLLSAGYSLQGARTGAEDDLRTAVQWQEAAVRLTPPTSADAAAEHRDLASRLTALFHTVGDAALLHEAMQHLEQARRLVPVVERVRWQIAEAMADVIQTGYEQVGIFDIDQAIALVRTTLRQTPLDMHASLYQTLGNALRVRHARTGETPNIYDALTALRSARDLDDRVEIVGDLATALSYAFDLTHERALLDEAIELARSAVGKVPRSPADRALWCSNLAGLLNRRFKSFGHTPALLESVNLHREAVAVVPETHPARPRYLNNLGTALTLWIEEATRSSSRTRPPAEVANLLTVAVGAQREAVRLTSVQDPAWAGRAVNLAQLLLMTYRLEQQPELLEEAEAVYRNLLRSATAGRPFVLTRAGLADVLAERFHATGDIAQRAEAIAHLRVGVKRSAENVSDLLLCRQRLTQLLAPFLEDHTLGGTSYEQDEALRLRRGMALDVALPATTRAHAANEWGHTAAIRGDFEEALAGLRAAIELLDQVAWHGLEQHDQQRLLSQFAMVASNAAAVALRCKQLNTAVELLEQGRAVLLSRRFNDRRAGAVSAVAQHLVDELSRIEQALDTTPQMFDPFSTEVPADQLSSTVRTDLAQRRQVLLAEIRATPGCTEFRRSLKASDLYPAAKDHPVVILNVSSYGSTAIILHGDDLHELPLPALKASDAADSAVRFLDALRLFAGSGGASPAEVFKAHHTVTDTMAWLWRTAARPVLDRLGLTEQSDSPPRLTWCPTGFLTFLPIHAAGDPGPHAPAVCDYAVSSYTPTLSTLLAAQARTADALPAPLFIDVGEIPDAGGLPGVRREQEAILDLFPSGRMCDPVTHDRVLAALGSEPWIHFAGHGSQDAWDFGRAHLVLPDGPLGIRDIATLINPSGQLAYLSACDTSMGEARLADEGLSIAVALHAVGYRHVIGALWPIGDKRASRLAIAVYQNLSRDGDSVMLDDLPMALHKATREIRARNPRDILAWAMMAHLGP